MGASSTNAGSATDSSASQAPNELWTWWVDQSASNWGPNGPPWGPPVPEDRHVSAPSSPASLEPEHELLRLQLRHLFQSAFMSICHAKEGVANEEEAAHAVHNVLYGDRGGEQRFHSEGAQSALASLRSVGSLDVSSICDQATSSVADLDTRLEDEQQIRHATREGLETLACRLY